jgi:hypothetical protein
MSSLVFWEERVRGVDPLFYTRAHVPIAISHLRYFQVASLQVDAGISFEEPELIHRYNPISFMRFQILITIYFSPGSLVICKTK